MGRRTSHNGFAIALAWPETLCKQAGAWYDALLFSLGLNRHGYYRVGHAAVVLVDDRTKACRYFDFGRYHAPHGHGRVRSDETDHDLGINTRAVYSKSRLGIANIREILNELHLNPSTHGDGPIYGSAIRIDVELAIAYAKRTQEKDFIAYGPFLPHGTNCSRFVSSVVRAGKPGWMQRLKFTFPPMLSPTPMWNLTACGEKIYCIGHSPRSAARGFDNPSELIIAP